MRRPEAQRRQIDEGEFNFLLNQRMGLLVAEFEQIKGIKQQIEASLDCNFIVDFFEDDEGQLSIQIRPKPKMGFVK